ncbi:MAG: Sua5/YciO/YrdC/YwlC family protein, partial [Dysgonamonadaceae bacterium]|nr:Sua5/YciO/YrdC/YwlC family protein [Dysgonamonadaceae bacterium]
RPATKPVILLVGSLKQAENFVEHIPNTAKQIIKTAKRPITIVYPKAKNIPQVAKAHNGSIAIRIPKNRFLKSLLKMLGQPIISTSANISGHKPPTNFQEITAEMLKHADHIVNLKRNSRKQNKPSAILEINANGQIKIIRK